MSVVKPKLGFLDAMRAGLALWVFWGHLTVLCAVNVPVLSAPGAAVDGFMMISGFLMVYTTKNTLGRAVTPRAVRDFYLTRFFRIAPLYYVMLLLCGLVMGPWEAARDAWWLALHGGSVGPLEPMQGLATMGGVLAHVSFIFGLMPSMVISVPLPDWSLSLEMQYYLLFPVLCAMVYLRWGILLGLVVFSTAAAIVLPRYLGYYGEPGIWAHFGQPSVIALKLNVFLVGMLLANWYMKGAGAGKVDCIWLVLAAVCLLSVKPVVWAFFLLFCFLLKMPTSRLARWLSAPLFGRLGDWSYGIYLVHIFVMTPTLWLMEQYWQLSRWAPVNRLIVALSICSILVFLVSALLHKWIEKPGIQWGRQWLAKE